MSHAPIPSRAEPLRADPRDRPRLSSGAGIEREAGPLRSLLIAIRLIIGSEIASLVVPFILGVVIGFHNASVRGGPQWSLSPMVWTTVSTIAGQLAMLLAARHRAALLGDGNIAAGWSNLRVRRRGTILLLGLIHPIILVVWVWFISHWLVIPPTGAAFAVPMIGTATDLPTAIAATVLLVALAPICEECFFRGWLWNSLRRPWPPVAVALVTSLLWLSVHYPDGGWVRVAALLPIALLLALARELGGSVRGSIFLHIVNNATAMALFSWVTLQAPH